MDMDADGHIRLAAHKISEFLEKGIPLTENTLHFIASTFSISTAGEINAVLTDPAHLDRETLVCSILYPDEVIQARLEPFLEPVVFSHKEIDALAQIVSGLSPVVRCIFPTPSHTVSFSPDFSEIMSFITRLNLLNPPDHRLVNVINDSPDRTRYFAARVKLRNARLKLTENKIQWLLLFFNDVFPEDDDNFKWLAFVLDFLHQVPDENDFYEEFMRLKRSLILALDRYNRFFEELERHNMETLMLRGVRPPSIQKEDAVDKISCIDDICIRIYGKTEPVHLPVSHRGADAFEQVTDLKDMMRRFL